jgi:hypothetical protein
MLQPDSTKVVAIKLLGKSLIFKRMPAGNVIVNIVDNLDDFNSYLY